MKFEGVISALRDGKKLTNSIIKNSGYKYIYYKGGTIFNNKGGYRHLTDKEIVEIDDSWEIVKETKKVKLRNLTWEQYIKWRKNNCCINLCGSSCPFKSINCAIGWHNYKEMYSDKFLDQEIEVDE